MEPFDLAVAFRVMMGRPPMRDAEPAECFQEPPRSELCSVVRRQRHVLSAAALGQHPFLHDLQFLFRGSIHTRFPAHAASSFGGPDST